ncbi:glyoxalase [Mycolicibacterium chitae]|uniref:Bleomycin resistance protein n=1 Tax=Mycolicibacterium chitae TaxID=1792 RepID=A0A448HXB1_MYCCI|nr:glyoxalase superfamily protein [Mycolicibacterium chitae]MCV7109022.1 bleomycin resistance family protein [Mycolicibacterium chitae]BBZ02321.1 glyoxalase [Mycolicibacterium chitae]VEG44678.1 glyoxalase/bleomycin resistance protein/dioxygenase [Mycolicibacterium chitae]
MDLTIDDANHAARVLRDQLPDSDLTHAEALEIVARQLGFPDWTTASAGLPSPVGMNAHVGMGAPVPVLRSFDEARAREFYVDYLHFSVEWEHRFEDAASPLYLRLRRDQFVLDLSEHHGDGTPGSTVWVPVSDVAALHEELRATGYGRINPGIDADSPGGPTLEVVDPFANTIRFCQAGG